MSSLSDKLSGKSKQTMGSITGDTSLQMEGHAEETRGGIKDKLRSMADAMKRKTR